MNTNVKIDPMVDTDILAENMSVGQVGIISSLPFSGTIVLRAYKSLISLSNPSTTWEMGGSNTLRVHLIPKGSVVSFEAQ